MLSDTLCDLHKYVASERVLSRRRERYTAERWARLYDYARASIDTKNRGGIFSARIGLRSAFTTSIVESHA